MRAFAQTVFHVLFAFFCVSPVLVPSAAWAARVEYSETAFQSALSSGKPVLLEFHASWCPTCKLQVKSLEAVMKEPENADLTVFAADFDTSAALLKTYKATTQGTLILFRGGKEVARSVGETDEAKLKAFVAQGK